MGDSGCAWLLQTLRMASSAGFLDALAGQCHGALHIALRQRVDRFPPQAGRTLAPGNRCQAQLAVAQGLQRQRAEHAGQAAVAAVARAEDQQAVGGFGIVVARRRAGWPTLAGAERRHAACRAIPGWVVPRACAPQFQTDQREFPAARASSAAFRSVTMAPRRASRVARPSRSRMRRASRIGPRLTLNSSASSCSPMRAPGGHLARQDAVAHASGNLFGDGQCGRALVGKQPECDGAFPCGKQLGWQIRTGFMAVSPQDDDGLVVGHRLAFGHKNLAHDARGRWR